MFLSLVCSRKLVAFLFEMAAGMNGGWVQNSALTDNLLQTICASSIDEFSRSSTSWQETLVAVLFLFRQSVKATKF
jgi:hypothetical protein